MSPDIALMVSMAVPAAGALLVWLCGRWPNLREAATLLTSLVLFCVVLSIHSDFSGGTRASYVLATVLPGSDGGQGLQIALSVEPLGLLFALVASGLWIVTSFYAIGYMRGLQEHAQTRFYICFAISLFATMGIAFADNMLTLFVFYEVLSLSTYPLVTHHEDEEAKQGGRTYIGLLMGTSIGLLLFAVLFTYAETGTLTFTAGGIMAGKVPEGLFHLRARPRAPVSGVPRWAKPSPRRARQRQTLHGSRHWPLGSRVASPLRRRRRRLPWRWRCQHGQPGQRRT